MNEKLKILIVGDEKEIVVHKMQSLKLKSKEILYKNISYDEEIPAGSVDIVCFFKNSIEEVKYKKVLEIINKIGKSKFVLIYVKEPGRGSMKKMIDMMRIGFSDFINISEKESIYELIHRYDLKAIEKNINKEIFKTALFSIGDGVILSDMDGNVTFINKAACEIIETVKEKVIGEKVYKILVIRDSLTGDIYRNIFHDVIISKKKVGLKKESIIMSEKGNVKYISASNAPILNDDEEMMGVVTVFRDITNIKKAEEKIKIERENVSTILNNIEFGIVIYDQEGKVKQSNKKIILPKKTEVETIYDYFYNLKELIIEGEEKIIFTKNDDIKVMLRKYFFNNKNHNLTAKIQNEKGNFWINIFQKSMDINYKKNYMMVIEDITENSKMELELKQNETNLRLITENMNDSVCRTDINGKIEYISHSFLKRYLGGKNLLGKNISEITKNINLNENRFEIELKTINNKTIWFEVDRSDIKDEEEKVIGYVYVFRDRTIKKKVEEDLKRATEIAEAANKAKSEFLANMSHEIRTPMNGIVGMTNLTLMTDLEEGQRENLTLIKESADAMLKIINDILDFSKIEAGKINIEKVEFNIKKLVDRIIKGLSGTARQKGLELELEVDEELKELMIGDYNKIRQILNNLLVNAIKFTEKGVVRLVVKKIKTDDKFETIRFVVEDTGIGIEEKDLDNIFKSFKQVDGSITRKFGGTGLGLTISNKLSDMIGGKLWVESEIGEGSKFHFEIELEISNTNTYKDSEYDVTIPENKETLNILIAEDDRINQMLAKNLLKKQNHNVFIASNGKEAVDMFFENKIDMILMDIQMPERDGIEATKLIREKDQNIPIIAVTAHVFKGDRQRFMSVGMNDYIPKPINIQKFFEVIEKYSKYKNQNIEVMSEKEDIIKFTSDDLKLKVEDLRKSIDEVDFQEIDLKAGEVKKIAIEVGNLKVKRNAFKIQLISRKDDIEGVKENFEKILKNIM